MLVVQARQLIDKTNFCSSKKTGFHLYGNLFFIRKDMAFFKVENRLQNTLIANKALFDIKQYYFVLFGHLMKIDNKAATASSQLY